MKTLEHILHIPSRSLLSLAFLALGWLLSGSNAPAAIVSWSGAGGDDLWSNPLNWNGGALPTSEDDVVINVPGTVTVRMDAPYTTVRSLQCQESFLLEYGPFTVTAGASVINGVFSMNPSQTLAALGPTTAFTANGPTTNVWALQAVSGAVLTFPSARQLTVGASPFYLSWNAYGEGSAINLTNLTNVVIAPGYSLDLAANSGGRIDVRRLLLPEGSIRVSAQNTNSMINLSGFNGLWSLGMNGGYNGSLSAGDGGTVLIPNVTALDRVDLYLSGDANVNIAQLRSFTDGTLTLSSRTNGFSGLTNFSGSISAYDSRLDWTNFTVLYATNNSTFSIGADQGSIIDLSRVTNVVLTPGYGMNVRASAGSRIDLRRLRPADGAFYMYVNAYNTGSLVDFSGLTGLWDGNNSSVRADDGGTVSLPNVTAMNKVNLELRHDAVVPTAQLRSFTDGSITLYNRTNGFAGLTNFNGYFYVTDTRLDLTNFNVLYATNSQLYFQAQQGSSIDLSRLTNVVTGSSGYGLYAVADGGSRIDLRRLHVPDGPVSVGASGDSVIDLSGFSGVWSGGGGVTASTGGTVLMPNVTALDGVSLNVSDSANVNLTQLNSIIAGSITLRSRTNDLTGLTNFTGSLNAYDSRLELTNLTVLYVTNHMDLAADQNSLIDLSHVTNVVMTGWTLRIYAYNGGRIDLSQLSVPPGGPFYIDARNPNSVVDLSGFNGLWHANDSVAVSAGNSAAVLISNVTAMRSINLSLSDDANVPTTQLRSFTEGSIRLSVRTNVFTALTNFTGWLSCEYLARAEFPKLTQLIATNNGISFGAQNDCVIDLSGVTNAVVDFGNTLSFGAGTGGRIELPNMETIVAGNVNVVANGMGAVVDLSGLTGFFSDNNGGSLQSLNGGEILLNPDAMLLAGVAIDFQSNPDGPVPPFLAASQSLVLYGQPWRSYRIESRNPLDAGSLWQLYKRVALTETLKLIGARPPTDLVLRVYAFIANPPELDVQVPDAGLNQVILFGVPEQTYRLESTTSIANPIIWENGPTKTMTNSFFIFPSAGTTNDARFYRARKL